MADQSEYNGALLAYLGDAVTELWVRETLLSLGVRSAAACNAEALGLVTAKAQSESFSRVEGMLTRDESDAFRLGRNAHIAVPKSATSAEYHRATGFEALIGSLYLSGRRDRIDEILSAAYADVIGEIRARHSGARDERM